MRILFVTYELPPIGGGGGRAAWQIARRLAGRWHEVRILTSLFGNLPGCETRKGVGIHRIAVRRSRPDACSPRELLSFMRRSIPETRRLARDFAPDVVCAFFAIPGGPAAWRLWRRARVPYVVSLRGSDVPRPELSKYQRLHLFTRPFIRKICREAAGLIAVSGALRDAALNLLPGADIAVVSNGVDAEFFSEKPDATPPDPADPPVIVYVGRLRPFKGAHHALAALPAIEKTLGRGVRLVVVGEGPEMSRLCALAGELPRESGAPTVRFTGWLEPEKVREIYAAASLAVLPSLVEGHPNVLLEAMAMGLPCVASDVPGIREVVADGSGGILVPPEDPAAIARAACDILGDLSRRKAMGLAARARAESFSWDATAARYETILQDAARRPKESD